MGAKAPIWLDVRTVASAPNESRGLQSQFQSRPQAKTAELKPKTSELKPKNARNKTQEAHSNESSHFARCPNYCPRTVFSRYDLRASAQNEAPDLRAKAQDFETTSELTPKTSKLKPKSPKLKLSGSL